MSNPTHLPVRRVRAVSVNNGATGAPSLDSENAQEHGAYDGYEGYEGYEGEEEYEQPQRTGLFSSPARALALGGSVVALLLVFAVAIFVANGRSNQGPVERLTTDVAVIAKVSQTGGLTTGSVPPNFEWTDPATGRTVSLAGLKGKPVWINFWGTWCPPSRAEMPAMQQVYSKHKDDLIILGISMAPRDDPGIVSEFLKHTSYTWTFVHDQDQAVALKYRAGSIPTSYFIGADGTVKAVSVGAIPESMMENFIAQAKQ